MPKRYNSVCSVLIAYIMLHTYGESYHTLTHTQHRTYASENTTHFTYGVWCFTHSNCGEIDVSTWKRCIFQVLPTHSHFSINSLHSYSSLFPIQCFDSSRLSYVPIHCLHIENMWRVFFLLRFVVLLDKTIRDWRKYKQINKRISFINTSFNNNNTETRQKWTAIKSLLYTLILRFEMWF